MGLGYDVKIYSTTQVKILAFGVPVSKGPGASGYGPSTFLEVEQDGASWKVVKGADGTIVRCATNEPGTKASVHLLQSSASNALFSAMWNLGLKSTNGEDIGTFVGSDMQGTSVFEAEAMWVMGPPKRSYAQEVTEMIWELYCCKVERFDGGN